VPSVPVLANNGAMNEFIGAFEVTSTLSGHVYHCSFSHIWNAIATRHSDTIDAKFVVMEKGASWDWRTRLCGIRAKPGAT